MARRYPALDVHAPPREPGPLSWLDAVTVMVDEHSPFAIDEPAPGLVRVYFTSSDDLNAAISTITSTYQHQVQTHAHWVTDDDWASRSQANLQAVQIGQIIVAPPWDLPKRPVDSTDITVIIQPALGFGSGHHETTRLALLGLQELNLKGLAVLDLGTGSGVLAIAAIKLGGRRALGIDRDPDAIASAQDSVRRNGVTDRVELRTGNISELAAVTAPVVIANLTGPTLTTLASVITTSVESGGHLVVTGILDREETAVLQAYNNQARVVWRHSEGEWIGLVMQNRGAQARTKKDKSK